VNLVAPEPAPIPTTGPAVWDLVRADVAAQLGPGAIRDAMLDDMAERDRVGRVRYGTPLQTGNGRDALVDAYQEALDLCVYLRQAVEEGAPEQRLFRDAVHFAYRLRFAIARRAA
jgi:hypothetical protein